MVNEVNLILTNTSVNTFTLTNSRLIVCQPFGRLIGQCTLSNYHVSVTCVSYFTYVSMSFQLRLLCALFLTYHFSLAWCFAITSSILFLLFFFEFKRDKQTTFLSTIFFLSNLASYIQYPLLPIPSKIGYFVQHLQICLLERRRELYWQLLTFVSLVALTGAFLFCLPSRHWKLFSNGFWKLIKWSFLLQSVWTTWKHPIILTWHVSVQGATHWVQHSLNKCPRLQLVCSLSWWIKFFEWFTYRWICPIWFSRREVKWSGWIKYVIRQPISASLIVGNMKEKHFLRFLINCSKHPQILIHAATSS